MKLQNPLPESTLPRCRRSQNNNPICSVFAVLIVFDYAPVSYLVNNAHAETGIGKDIFKVVVSVFGAYALSKVCSI